MSIADDIRGFWDVDAATYDQAVGHRPRSTAVWAAWTGVVQRCLPAAPVRVLDCGAGTGFLSVIAARLGHHVTALDVSAEMLKRLKDAAARERLEIDVIVGSAHEPPRGFDAVMERHLLWTLPDPLQALRAWRQAAPGGGLLLVESIWGEVDSIERIRSHGREWLRRMKSIPPDHHASYPQSVRAGLPLGGGTPPSRVIELAMEAGWQCPRLERLWDVEWAATADLPFVHRLLGVSQRYVVTAS
jgi:SAM-dependent methyltransferase